MEHIGDFEYQIGDTDAHNSLRVNLAIDGPGIIGRDSMEADPVLLDLLNDQEVAIFFTDSVCSALEKIGDNSDQVIQTLLNGIKNEGNLKADEMCFALGELGSPDDLDLISELTNIASKKANPDFCRD